MTTDRWMGIVLVVVITVLVLWVEHWGPWERLLRRRLHNLVNYVLGVLALDIPLTGLFAVWGAWNELIALWLVTIFGGLAVMLAYAIDGWNDTGLKGEIAKREAQTLRPKVDHDPGPVE